MKKTVLLVCYLILILSLGGCRLVRIEEEKECLLSMRWWNRNSFLRKRLHLWKKKGFRVQGHISERKRALSDQRLRKTDERRIQHSGKRAFSFFHGCIFETKLMGPSAEEQSGAPSYPYIAVKIQYRKEPVQFQ